MSWQNEVRSEIKFSSPLRKTFYAKWRGNERSFEKKLGEFSPPNFSGTIVQDLSVKSTLYPLTIYFDGMFHHREADNFLEALKEPGQWEVVHPVKGPLILQLVSVKENIQPVENGAYTEFDMQWIEPANVKRLISVTELAGSILTQIMATVEDSLALLDQLKADLYAAISSALGTFNKIAGFMDSTVSEVASTSAIIQDLYDAARSSFSNAIDNFSVSDPDTTDIVIALVNMAMAPTNALTDFPQRFAAYQELFDAAIGITPTTTIEEDYNAIIAQEFGITVILITIAQIVITSEFSSRTEVISAIENITTMFNDAVAALDAAQNNFITLAIDRQYFSQTKTYTSLVHLYSLCLQYLISQFYNLRAEKRITLGTARSPIEITVTEYGSLGVNDENYDLFLTSNKLSGNDILIIPQNREIVIYVA